MLIHIRHKCVTCEKLLVYDVEMNSAQEVKYLGDIVDGNGKYNSTVSERIKIGYAIASQILEFLNDLPLGNLRVEVGLAHISVKGDSIFTCKNTNRVYIFRNRSSSPQLCDIC